MSCARAGQDALPTGLVGTLWEFYHSRFTIAFAVHSFGGLDLAIQTERVGAPNSRWSVEVCRNRESDLYGSSIALLFQSVDHSLSVRLIPPYKYTTNVQNRAQARLIKPRIT